MKIIKAMPLFLFDIYSIKIYNRYEITNNINYLCIVNNIYIFCYYI